MWARHDRQIFLATEASNKRTLINLYADEKDVSFVAAENRMSQIAKDGRYALDIWAGN